MPKAKKQKSLKDRVPKEFWNGVHPQVTTVGELREQLARLPDDLPLGMGEDDSTFQCIVYNVSGDDAHFQLSEMDGF